MTEKLLTGTLNQNNKKKKQKKKNGKTTTSVIWSHIYTFLFSCILIDVTVQSLRRGDLGHPLQQQSNQPRPTPPPPPPQKKNNKKITKKKIHKRWPLKSSYDVAND